MGTMALEPYVNGTPAPTIVTKEVDMVVAAPFLLVNPDFSKTEVVKAYAHTIVAPVIDYWKQTIEGKKGDQLERMKAVRISTRCMSWATRSRSLTSVG